MKESETMIEHSSQFKSTENINESTDSTFESLSNINEPSEKVSYSTLNTKTNN